MIGRYDRKKEINNILIDGIRVNYLFDITNKTRSNFNSLKKTFESKGRPTRKSGDKKFLIKQLDIRDINVSASSAELNLNQKVKLITPKLIDIISITCKIHLSKIIIRNLWHHYLKKSIRDLEHEDQGLIWEKLEFN